jgi:hypothetical protein
MSQKHLVDITNRSDYDSDEEFEFYNSMLNQDSESNNNSEVDESETDDESEVDDSEADDDENDSENNEYEDDESEDEADDEDEDEDEDEDDDEDEDEDDEDDDEDEADSVTELEVQINIESDEQSRDDSDGEDEDTDGDEMFLVIHDKEKSNKIQIANSEMEFDLIQVDNKQTNSVSNTTDDFLNRFYGDNNDEEDFEEVSNREYAFGNKKPEQTNKVVEPVVQVVEPVNKVVEHVEKVVEHVEKVVEPVNNVVEVVVQVTEKTEGIINSKNDYQINYDRNYNKENNQYFKYVTEFTEANQVEKFISEANISKEEISSMDKFTLMKELEFNINEYKNVLRMLCIYTKSMVDCYEYVVFDDKEHYLFAINEYEKLIEGVRVLIKEYKSTKKSSAS